MNNNKIKILVFTGSRAEYGLLKLLMKAIDQDANFDLQLVVSGSHLSKKFGYTYNDIVSDGFFVNKAVEIDIEDDSPKSILKSMSKAISGYTDAFLELMPDIVIILGDRYEALAAAQTAMMLDYPILHIHGGEITQGAKDDSIRHAITKLSYLHITSSETHKKRVIQLGESPDRVFNFGAIGLDNIKEIKYLSKDELSEIINFKIDGSYFLVTYHPVTYGKEDEEITLNEIFKALDYHKKYKIIFTYPNADENHNKIISLIRKYVKSNHQKAIALESLGTLKYLSLLKNSSLILGNSSSGIIEAPSLNVPTINIGIRQEGRLAAKSVLNSNPSSSEIIKKMNQALNGEYKNHNEEVIENPYYNGDVVPQIVSVLKNMNVKNKKSFYDIKIGDNKI